MKQKDYIKLLVNEWFKEYSVLNVSEKCFDNSPEIETAGTMTGFKIHSQKELMFKIEVLKNKCFKLEVQE